MGGQAAGDGKPRCLYSRSPTSRCSSSSAATASDANVARSHGAPTWLHTSPEGPGLLPRGCSRPGSCEAISLRWCGKARSKAFLLVLRSPIAARASLSLLLALVVCKQMLPQADGAAGFFVAACSVLTGRAHGHLAAAMRTICARSNLGLIPPISQKVRSAKMEQISCS